MNEAYMEDEDSRTHELEWDEQQANNAYVGGYEIDDDDDDLMTTMVIHIIMVETTEK